VFFEIYNPDAPEFTTTIPPNKELSGSGSFSWIASDPDPDETQLLIVNVYYSSDKITWIPLANGVPNSGSYTWDVTEIPDGVYALKIEIPDPIDTTLIATHIFDGVIVNNPDAPTVSFTQAPANGANVSGIVSYNWEGADLDEDALTYSLYYRAFGDTDWIPIVSGIDATSYSWNTSSLKTGNYQVRIVARDNSKTHLETEEIIGPFQIYVKSVVGPGGDGTGQDPTKVTDDNSNDNTVLFVAIAVLLLLFFVVIGLVVVVMIRKNSAPKTQLPPPGGLPIPPAGTQTPHAPDQIPSGKL
jgi:hypothetical protein